MLQPARGLWFWIKKPVLRSFNFCIELILSIAINVMSGDGRRTGITNVLGNHHQSVCTSPSAPGVVF